MRFAAGDACWELRTVPTRSQEPKTMMLAISVNSRPCKYDIYLEAGKRHVDYRPHAEDAMAPVYVYLLHWSLNSEPQLRRQFWPGQNPPSIQLSKTHKMTVPRQRSNGERVDVRTKCVERQVALLMCKSQFTKDDRGATYKGVRIESVHVPGTSASRCYLKIE